MTDTILITGGTGLIGSKIIELLLQKGYAVHCLSRSAHQSDKVTYFKWDVHKQELDEAAFENVTGIIHLAGAGIADERWSRQRKKVILESRTKSTELLLKSLKSQKHSVASFVGASAIGWYGETGDKLVDEDQPAGKGFMADVVKAWELGSDKVAGLGIRTVKIRIGVVLSHSGGALAEMAKPVKWRAGAPLGSGKQYMSWVHEDDIARLFVHALENEKMEGVYNGVAPRPATNQEITQQIAKVMHKPLWLPNVPEFALRLILGEMADMVLISNRTSSKKTESTGFQFKYPDLKPAIADLLG